MARIHITTQGCSANHAESEVMAGILNKGGHTIVQDKEDADLMLINVCTVKGPHTALREIRSVIKKHPEKKLVVAGCISKELRPKIKELNQNIAMVSTNTMVEVGKAVDSSLNDDPAELFEQLETEKINFPRVRNNPLVGIVPISSGCKQSCAYCTVVQVKGTLQSYAQQKIVEEVKQCVADGCKEIWLTSQDTASYRLEEKEHSKLHLLLNDLCTIDGDFHIRVGMMNPTFVKPVLNQLIKSFQHEKIFKFLHLPLQAGSDRILDLMDRGYHINDFEGIVAAFRKAIPEITIATDVIVGLPSETEEDVEQTLAAIKRSRPGVCNISRFVARPYTRAYYMKEQVHGNIKKDWSRRVTKLFSAVAYEEKMRWLGWSGEILITTEGNPGTKCGRNYAYVPVIVKGGYPIGTKLEVKVIGLGAHYVEGEVIALQ